MSVPFSAHELPEVDDRSLVSVLRHRARYQPDKLVYLIDGEPVEAGLTHAELDRRARAVGARLVEAGATGERAVLLYPPGLDYIVAFFGCLYAGAIAVPAYPPNPVQPARTLPRLLAIVHDSGAKFALTTAPILSVTDTLFGDEPGFAGLRWLATDEAADAATWTPIEAGPGDIAFLQYTSGSTATPKGVVLSHGNLIHNSRMIHTLFEHSPATVGVNWLPPYHDMGLIGSIIQPLYAGFPAIMMSPLDFLQRPLRWLEAISRTGATTSGGPNFAYELCVRKSTPEQRAELDLSSWDVAFNGAEPVRPETLDRFAEAFAPSGFSPSAFHSCYGLAEATLMVTGGRTPAPRITVVDPAGLARNLAVRAQSGRRLVSAGHAASDQLVTVVDPTTARELGDGEIGEVWVSGPSVGQGYWGDPKATAETFHAHLADTGERPFLRTGDLGFLADGELTITGRLKDLIIIRGRNHYPQDIELTVESFNPLFRPGCTAAFTVDEGPEERLVVIQEVAKNSAADDLIGLAPGVREAVAAEQQVQVHTVVLIEAGTIPKSSSGKIQRRLCRRRFLDGELTELGRDSVAEVPEGDPAEVTRQQLIDAPADVRKSLLTSYLRALLADVCRVDASGLSLDTSLLSLGIDSLAAIDLKQEVEQRLGIVLPLTGLLEGATLLAVVTTVDEQISVAGQAERDTAAPAPVTPAAEVPASYGQRALWFLHQLAPRSPAHSVVEAVRLHGDLNVPVLRAAFDQLVARHGSLRTTFIAPDGQPRRRVHAPGPADFTEIDACGLADFDQVLADAVNEPFDLERGPLLRVRLYRRGAAEHVLLLALHHIITDFWSMTILVRELGELYRALSADAGAALPELTVDYDDFVAWQAEHVTSPDGRRSASYWRERLAGGPPEFGIHTARTRRSSAPAPAVTRSLRLSLDLSARIRTRAQAEGATTYMLLLAAYQLLLSRYGAGRAVVVGTPMAGRGQPGFDRIVGYCMNPVVVPATLSPGMPFTGLLADVRRAVIGALEHQDLPAQLLAEQQGSELFRTLFVYNRPPGRDSDDLPLLSSATSGTRRLFGNLGVEAVAVAVAETGLDIELAMAEVDGALSATFRIRSDLFDAAVSDGMPEQFVSLLEAITADPSTPVHRLAVPAGTETSSTPEPTEDVIRLFERQVEACPDGIAVVSGDRRMSYRELNDRANRLAYRLAELGTTVERRVGVLVGRSPDLVVTILAVLKTGAAYVPVDVSHPAERASEVFAGAGVDLVVTDAEIGLPWPSVPVADPEGVALPSWDLPVRRHPESIAYVIHTSGSTGEPKGVQVPHRSLAHYTRFAADEFAIDEAASVLQFASISFDTSVEEIFPALTHGATLVLSDGVLRDPAEFWAWCAEAEVTVVDLPTAYWHELAAAEDVPVPDCVQVVVVGGERLEPALVERWAKGDGRRARVVNTYGVTEATVVSTVGELPATGIGHAIPGVRAYVLDDSLVPCVDGVVGELYLGGAGVARGYLGRPGLTAERFVADPYGPSGARLYRTGDLVHRLSDGTFEFLGRADGQLKLRGFRIEPAEVETALARHPAVEQVAVVPREDRRGARLIAYLVATPDCDVDDVRAFAAARLPEYMVPSAFVVLDALPLTSNGKVDRAALPVPDVVVGVGRVPGSVVEVVLCRVFGEVLGVDRVFADDGFFDLGGHSLLATRLVSRVRSELGVELPVRSVFEFPRVMDLAGVVAGAGRARVVVTRRERPERLPVSFAQRRLWLLDRIDGPSAAYNIPLVLRLRGVLDVDALRLALSDVVDRHESLRTVFDEVDGEPVQRILPAGGGVPPLIVESVEPKEVDTRIEKVAGAAFDLAEDLPLAGHLFEVGPEEYVLVVVLHHIASDGWSVGPLAVDLAEAYRARVVGGVPGWVSLPVQYADYALWQRDLLGDESDVDSVVARQVRFWSGVLAGLPVELALPVDRPRPVVGSRRGASVVFDVSAGLHADVVRFARDCGVTVFMVVQAALATLLSKLGAGVDVPIGTPVAGRTDEALDGLIGFFVNTLVLRTDLSGSPSFRELVGRVRSVDLAAFAHQDLPFERLVEVLNPERSLSRHPLFQTMLVLQNNERPQLDVPGVDVRIGDAETGVAKFDLYFSLAERHTGEGGQDGIDVRLEYATDLFDHTTAVRMAGLFTRVLGAVIGAPDRPVRALDLVSDAGYEELIARGTGSRIPDGPTLLDLVRGWVVRRPEDPAVIAGDRVLGYGELDGRANRLARVLAARGIGREDVVALALPRSAELVVALLAVLKAGAACLVADLGYPAARNEFTVRDAKPAVVLTAGGVPFAAGSRCLDLNDPEFRRELAESSDVEPVGLAPTLGNAAMVWYTSGSTGRPNGVVSTHRALANRLRWYAAEFPVGVGEVFLAKTSLSFVDGATELLGALTNGVPLVFADDGQAADPAELARLAARHSVTRLTTVPSLLEMLISDTDLDQWKSVRTWVSSGEELKVSAASRFADAVPGSELVNFYGASETGGDSLFSRRTSEPALGEPVWNTRFVVLDDGLRPVPDGVVGEIYIEGAGLARGYLGQAGLTAARFVANPYGLPGSRLYRTGDLARRTADGNVRYVGRVDHQLKIRGVRVEPREIEATLLRHPSISQAVVLSRHGESGEPILTGYVVPADGDRPGTADLRAYLVTALPAMMVPSAFVVLDALPLTPNGKLDRAALPEPVLPQAGAGRAPSTPDEELICRVFAEVLGLDRVSVDDGFFELGGHSLLATRLASRIRSELGVELPVRMVFEGPTVAELAASLAGLGKARPRLRPMRPATTVGQAVESSGEK